MPLLLFLVLAVFGLFIGTLTGIFGVGGGFLITPMLITLLGIGSSTAVGSDLCLIVGTSAAGFRRHMRLGSYDLATIFYMAMGAVVGAVLGTLVHQSLKALAGEELFDLLILIFYLPMLLTTAWLVFRGSGTALKGKSLLQRFPIGPRADLKLAGIESISLSGLIGIGLMIGILTGLLGIGGGVLFMPILLLVVGLDAHKAVGTSLGVILFASMSGVISHSVLGHGESHVSLMLAMSLLVTSTIGVQLGAWLCHKLHAGQLRKYFSVVVLVAATVVSIKLIIALST